jgi:hypothetical protein
MNTARYAEKRGRPLTRAFNSPAIRYPAHARAGIVLSDSPDAGAAFLSITVANTMIDVVVASGTAIPDVIVHR